MASKPDKQDNYESKKYTEGKIITGAESDNAQAALVTSYCTKC